MPRSLTLLMGAAALALALGAPAGWLVLRLAGADLDGRTVAGELAAHSDLYLYLLLATAVAFGAFGVAAGALADRLALANRRLSDLALTDAVTGLKNARYFHERLTEETARARRSGVPLTLIIGDLDHFKRVNDRHGHAAGDQVLAAVGRVVAGTVRAGDSACRVGGEEFAVLCPSTEVAEALQVAERIRKAIAAEKIALADGPLSVTMSLGVAARRAEHDGSQLFTAADAAMYAAKQSGRNQVVEATI